MEPILPQAVDKQLTLIRKLVPYELEKPDLLKRLFEESYLGAELFTEFYSVPSIFKFDESFLEKESFIPTKKTLDALCSRFGEFTIYSEKPRDQGLYLLERNDLKEYFDESGCVFQEDLFESDNITHGTRERVQYGKPDPTFLIRLVEKHAGKTRRAAYIGDSLADALLIENARLQSRLNVVFFGVLCSSQHPDQLFLQFMDHDADAIMTDVNDIPHLYMSLGGRTE